MLFATLVATATSSCWAQSTALTAFRKDWWNVQVAYPHFKAGGPVAATANQAARAAERREFQAFVADARRDVPELKKIGSAAAFYELLVRPTVTMDTPALSSGYCMRYVFTGGAHGTTGFNTMNYGRVGGKIRTIELADLFVKGVDPVAQASMALLEQLLKLERVPSMVQEGSWTKLDGQQAKQFVITPRGLLFLFGNYELGSYAEGTFRVLVPYSSISGLSPNGVLAPVFAG